MVHVAMERFEAAVRAYPFVTSCRRVRLVTERDYGALLDIDTTNPLAFRTLNNIAEALRADASCRWTLSISPGPADPIPYFEIDGPPSWDITYTEADLIRDLTAIAEDLEDFVGDARAAAQLECGHCDVALAERLLRVTCSYAECCEYSYCSETCYDAVHGEECEDD